ncbi:MAG TPA: glycosyltransferase family 4 protein [Bacteroidia bacterium]|mgnify:FL=1|nr:glycosyltransferase family 4 protein [Bacteroidia bacterium]
MKICFFADGGSIHTVRWCTHFHKLGNEVHLITFTKVEIPNIHVHVIDVGNVNVSGGNWKVLFKFRKVKKLLAEISPDIFHALYATSYGITGALVGFHPYVITALGTDVLISPKQSKLYKALLKFAFSKADWITAMSDFMKKVIEEMGVASEKISTVPFGIDPAVFNSVHRKVSNDKFIVISTRNFESIYNIPHLINAIANIRNEIPNLQLYLIGAGSLKSELETLIEIRKLNDQVRFFGKLPQPEIASLLNSSQVFVSVSLSDGNNISLNEAMACGAFCIATDIPANTQWIQDSVNGFLVQIDDVDGLASKIVEAYKRYEELQVKAIPVNKKIIAEKGIWSTNMELVENKYKSLILKK